MIPCNWQVGVNERHSILCVYNDSLYLNPRRVDGVRLWVKYYCLMSEVIFVRRKRKSWLSPITYMLYLFGLCVASSRVFVGGL